jgi:hypothetical protein
MEQNSMTSGLEKTNLGSSLGMGGDPDTFNKFSSNNYVNASGDFLESNSLVAKVAFLLLVLFGFIILLRVGIAILGYFYGPTGSPKLINGLVDAKQLIVIPQDPNSSGAKTITRSENASDGIEFTWSTWIYIDDLTYNSGKYKCVFYKGNDFASEKDGPVGLNFPNNAPGLYIAPNTNALVIFMNTYNVINEEITIPNIPLNKWINVIIRCQNTTMDVYINGTITKSHQLHGVPKQNYGNVYVAMNGGFSGYISNLWYYNYALGTNEITKLVTGGPSTKMVSSGAGSATDSIGAMSSNYLSLRWFFFGSNL